MAKGHLERETPSTPNAALRVRITYLGTEALEQEAHSVPVATAPAATHATVTPTAVTAPPILSAAVTPGTSSPAPIAPTAVISYAWDTDEHQDQCLTLADKLRDDGVDADIDRYYLDFPEGLPLWMQRSLEGADFVVCVCTERYARRFRGEPEPEGVGLGAPWEGAIITQQLYDAHSVNHRFLPVVFSSDDIRHIPLPLRGVKHYVLWRDNEDLLRRIAGKPLILKPPLGMLPELPPAPRPANS